ncbi:hypothetical protein [Chitinophaga barathri]|uniref:Uncharacterized protein n=1 Tax=Chitinophaga barathri TaxID=1647451 RepID=A0A3N4ML92_9BACT|nr:hypothetical protein [Chitinophaga barathri]RPD40830.1 hypothetical protein EG028_12430 [Chitinophaga barathri]
MVVALSAVALRVQASDLGGNLDNNEDKLGKKTEVKYRLTAMPKTNLSLDAGFKANGFLNNAFKLSSDNAVSVKSVMTYKKGNVTYILPYSVKAQTPAPQVDMQYHHLQVRLPFRKG